LEEGSLFHIFLTLEVQYDRLGDNISKVVGISKILPLVESKKSLRRRSTSGLPFPEALTYVNNITVVFLSIKLKRTTVLNFFLLAPVVAEK